MLRSISKFNEFIFVCSFVVVVVCVCVYFLCVFFLCFFSCFVLFSNLSGALSDPLFHNQGPVIQSIVSLTTSLRGQLVKCFTIL